MARRSYDRDRVGDQILSRALVFRADACRSIHRSDRPGRSGRDRLRDARSRIRRGSRRRRRLCDQPPRSVDPRGESAMVETDDLPFVTGLDVAGTVREVGEGVSRVEPGDRVVLCPNETCGQCRFCREGPRTCVRTSRCPTAVSRRLHASRPTGSLRSRTRCRRPSLRRSRRRIRPPSTCSGGPTSGPPTSSSSRRDRRRRRRDRATGDDPRRANGRHVLLGVETRAGPRVRARSRNPVDRHRRDLRAGERSVRPTRSSTTSAGSTPNSVNE